MIYATVQTLPKMQPLCNPFTGRLFLTLTQMIGAFRILKSMQMYLCARGGKLELLFARLALIQYAAFIHLMIYQPPHNYPQQTSPTIDRKTMQTFLSEFDLGETLLHHSGFVKVFGRERDKSGVVVYYWVYDGQKRFTAKPEELQKV